MNKFKEDICRIVGHNFGKKGFASSCVRCKTDNTKIWVIGKPVYVGSFPIRKDVEVIKYADIKTKRYNVLDRAKEKAIVQI